MREYSLMRPRHDWIGIGLVLALLAVLTVAGVAYATGHLSLGDGDKEEAHDTYYDQRAAELTQNGGTIVYIDPDYEDGRKTAFYVKQGVHTVTFSLKAYEFRVTHVAGETTVTDLVVSGERIWLLITN